MDVQVLGLRWLEAMDNGDMVLAGGRNDEIVVPEVDAHIVLDEPWESANKVITSKCGEIEHHDLQMAEDVHDHLVPVGDGA